MYRTINIHPSSFIFHLCTVMMLAFAMPIWAQQNSNDSQRKAQELDSIWRDMELEQVVVTGTRTPKLLKDTPIQTRLISSRDIQKVDATNIEDMLQQELPGVEFSYAMNQQVNMNLAGFAGQSVLFLVDGERLAGETMDNVDFNRLIMAGVERIEIVKGSASALYGSSAAGGVINIITKEPTRPWSLNINGRLAEHNGQRYGGSFGLHQGIFSNMLTVSRTSSDDYDVHSLPDPETRVFSQVFGEQTWNIKDQLTIRPLSNLKLTARAGYFFRTLERTQGVPERYRDFTGGLRADWAISKHSNLEASYAFDEYDKSDYQRLVGLDVRSYSNVQNSARILFNHTLQRGDVLTLGGDYMHDYLYNSKLDDPRKQQDAVDVFAQYDWRISHAWEVVAALRYDHFSDGNISRLTPKLSTRYQTGRLTMRASYGMGFRAPTLKEKYYNFDMASIWIVLGNADLKPETSHNFTLSAEYTAGCYNFNVSGYYNRVENRITTGIPYYKPGDQTQLYLDYVNIDAMNVYSLEATAQARWHNGIGAKVSYAYTDEHTSTANANQYMPARHHSVTARLDYDHQFSKWYGFNVALSGRVLSAIDNEEYRDMYDISKGTVTIHYPAYTLWKLQLTNRLSDFLQLNIAVDNIFNYKPDYYYYNAPLTTGTNLMVGISLDVDRIF